MRVVFSEAKSDYQNYIFPYAVWAFPEEDETPANIFDSGFLPAARDLRRFYLCRQVRINLAAFSPSSENRRILRKGEDINFKLIPREEFKYNTRWRTFCKHYADIKFGKDVMTKERLDSLFSSQLVTDVLLFIDSRSRKHIGLVTLFLQPNEMAYYYYAFYDLNYYERNLGIYMMTSAVRMFDERDYRHIYLGTCYSRNAMYKTQFAGAQFFNGFRWSDDMKELKHIIVRDKTAITEHLVENAEFRETFYSGGIEAITQGSSFFLKKKN